MAPNEMLTYSEKGDQVKVDTVNTLAYISWKDQKFIFDNTPVKEIAQKITDYYGYTVVIENEELSERKVSGTLVVPNADKLIDILSTLLFIDIEKKGHSLIFKNYAATEKRS